MRTRLTAAIAITIVGLADAAPIAADTTRLKVTHRDLVPLCFNGSSVEAGIRSWNVVVGEIALVFTMRPAQRTGVPSAEPGTAAVTFSAESGHRYEVEVRADPMAFSTRAWRSGEWTPVVRDRTTDAIVSSAPVWSARASCR